MRNLDNATGQEGLNHTPVEFETFPLGDSSGTRRTADCNYGTIVTPESLAAVNSFEPHTAEGIDPAAHNEFLCESSDSYDTTAPGVSENLLLPKTAMIHAIGLQPGDYGAMAVAGSALIWSPRSNITLYGDTARVSTAARFGVEIALGTDWTPTGSINMLRELRCADHAHVQTPRLFVHHAEPLLFRLLALEHLDHLLPGDGLFRDMGDSAHHVLDAVADLAELRLTTVTSRPFIGTSSSITRVSCTLVASITPSRKITSRMSRNAATTEVVAALATCSLL